MQGSIEKVMYSSVPLLDELIRTVCTSQLSSGANGPGNQVEHEGLGAKFVALERLASQQAQGWPRLFGERLPLTIARVKEGELLSKRVGERVALRIQPNEVASCRVHTHDAPGTIYLDQPVGHGAKNRLQFDRGASSILVLVIMEDVKIVRISLVRRIGWHNVLVEIEDSGQAPGKENHAAIGTMEGTGPSMLAVLQVQTHRVVLSLATNDAVARRRSGVCAAWCSSRLSHCQCSFELEVKNSS